MIKDFLTKEIGVNTLKGRLSELLIKLLQGHITFVDESNHTPSHACSLIISFKLIYCFILFNFTLFSIPKQQSKTP